MAKKKGTHTVIKSAVSGKFVTKEYAKRHPDKTVRQTVKNPKR